MVSPGAGGCGGAFGGKLTWAFPGSESGNRIDRGYRRGRGLLCSAHHTFSGKRVASLPELIWGRPDLGLENILHFAFRLPELESRKCARCGTHREKECGTKHALSIKIRQGKHLSNLHENSLENLFAPWDGAEQARRATRIEPVIALRYE